MKSYQLTNNQSIQPHPSINAKEFEIQYKNHQELWDKAFQFIEENDLAQIAVGKYELVGERCFAIISEYETKPVAQCKTESHQDYIDIQYVVQGKELIGLTTKDYVTVTEPHDESRDVAFYSTSHIDHLEADPSAFFLFFPTDYHQPGVSAGAVSTVRKLVVKIENYKH